MRRIVVFVLALLLMAVSAVAQPHAQIEAGEGAVVVTVIDGDTIDVRLDATGEVVRVRYIGVNTAERGEPCYAEGTAENADLVSRQAVVMVKDISETDRFGRLLRYVFVDGLLVNAELVRLGVAEAVEYPPDTARAAAFSALEAEAARAGRGCLHEGTGTAAVDTYYVSGSSINVRSCERTSCARAATLTYGTPVIVLGSVVGEMVAGSTAWYQVRLSSGDTAYIHSSLLSDRAPATPRPTVRPATGGSGGAPAAPVSTPLPAQVSTPIPPPPGPGYACNCQRTCGQMTCDEAYFQLNQCGCSRRDGDGDGVPCEDICPGG